MSRLLRLLLLVSVCAAPLAGFPNGAPTEACIHGMVPNHGQAPQDSATMPFRISRQNTVLRDGQDAVKVIIEPPTGIYFRGFMLMAGDPTTGQWAKNRGSWQQIANVTLMNECSSITHAERSEKASVSVTWVGSNDVTMHATIVKNFTTFWAHIPVQEAGGPQPQQFGAAAGQPQQFGPARGGVRPGVVTGRPFKQQFAPVVDQRHFNVQEFFRQ